MGRCAGTDPSEWAWRLADGRKGRPRKNEAAELFFSRFAARVRETHQRFPFAKAYEDVAEAWRGEGREVPFGYECAMRRWNALSRDLRTQLREGAEAAQRHDPWVSRERVAASLELACLDGRKPDVNVLFPGAAGPVRPLVVMMTDLHSGMILAWDVGRSEDAETIRRVACAAVRAHGIPDAIQVDNGRANEGVFGGTYRGRRNGEGAAWEKAFSALGMKTEAVRPYNGRSKPIERWPFKELAEYEAGEFHARRAYVGHRPDARPKDATGSVTLAEFRAWMERMVARLKARPSEALGGRSPAEAFRDGLAARATPVRVATDAQLALAARPAVKRMPDARTGFIRINGGVFEATEDRDLRNRLLAAREKGGVLVHADPADHHAPLLVTDLAGRLIGEVPMKERTEFRDRAAEAANRKLRKVIANGRKRREDALNAAAEAQTPPAAKATRSPAKAQTVVEGAFKAPAAKPRPLRETAAMDEAALNAPWHRRRVG